MKVLPAATALVDLVVRLWVAAVFFKSGLVKIQSWDTTILLFTNEYHVPLLPVSEQKKAGEERRGAAPGGDAPAAPAAGATGSAPRQRAENGV